MMRDRPVASIADHATEPLFQCAVDDGVANVAEEGICIRHAIHATQDDECEEEQLRIRADALFKH